jgi:hypothetical protein
MQKKPNACLKRALQPMPEFAKHELEMNGLEVYSARPEYQRDDDLSRINQAKLESTRQQRLAQMLGNYASEGGA